MKNKVLKTIIVLLFVILVMGSVCLLASCSRGGKNNNVTITFVTNGGNEISSITLKRGEELALPTAEKDGRVFATGIMTRILRAFVQRKSSQKKTKRFTPVTAPF